jgi:hypothetical protein
MAFPWTRGLGRASEAFPLFGSPRLPKPLETARRVLVEKWNQAVMPPSTTRPALVIWLAASDSVSFRLLGFSSRETKTARTSCHKGVFPRQLTHSLVSSQNPTFVVACERQNATNLTVVKIFLIRVSRFPLTFVQRRGSLERMYSRMLFR